MKSSAPLILWDRADLALGASAVMDSSRFHSPAQEPIEIIGMRTAVSCTGGALARNGAWIVASSVAAKIQIGKFQMTDGFVPLWILNDPVAYNADAYLASDKGYGPVAAGATPSIRLSTRWIFAKPMLVLGGDSVMVDLKREVADLPGDLDAAASIGVDVSFIARYVQGPMPRVTEIPLVLPSVPVRGSDPAYFKLRNPLTRPLWIERIIGRIESYSPLNFQREYLRSDPTIEMIDGDGAQIISSQARFNHVFLPGRRDWIFRRELSGNGYFDATVRINDPINLTFLRPMMAAFGSRREEIS